MSDDIPQDEAQALMPAIDAAFGSYKSGAAAAASICALVAALAKAQGEFHPIHRNRTAKIQPRDASKSPYTFDYADMDAIREATQAALSANGIAVSGIPVLIDGVRSLRLQFTHADGGWMRGELAIPALPEGQATEVIKAVGGMLSYLRRYLYNNMLNLSADGDADDDGSEPSGAMYADPVVHEGMKAARTIGELSRVMAGLNPADKRTYATYFNVRQNELRDGGAK